MLIIINQTFPIISNRNIIFTSLSAISTSLIK